MKQLKIGWIGSGFVGQVGHLNIYENINQAKIVALSELREKLGKKVIWKNNIKNFYKNYDEMINNENLDAIILIVHRNHTAYHAKRILQKKINLFTEKPQAQTYDTAKELVNIAKKNNLKYASGLMRRHDDGVKFAKKLFDNLKKTNELGSVVGADVTCFAGGDYCNIGNYIKTNEEKFNKKLCKEYPEWLNAKQGNLYNNFLNVYIHSIDLINYFFGKNFKINCVNLNRNKINNINFDMNSLPVNFKWRDINLENWYEELIIYFKKGCIQIKLQPAFLINSSAKVKIIKYSSRGANVIEEFNNFVYKWSFYNQHIDFLNSIKTKKKPISSCEETLVSLKMVNEIFKKVYK